MMPTTDRDAEILSAALSGATDADVAAEHGVSPQRVGQIRRAAGLTRAAGARPTDLITGRSVRGARLLARLVEASAAAEVEPEAFLDSAIIKRGA